MSNDKLQDEKEVAFYSALVNAWINTKMERDKTLLILSSGGIGILVTLLSTIGAVNCFGIVFYILAFIAFLCSMIILVIIFDKNSKHIEEAIKGKKDSDPKLDLLDKISLWSFIIGAFFAIVVGLNSAVYIQNKKGVEEMGKSNPIQSVKGKEITKSLSGVGGLAPEKPTDSVSGVGKISPQSDSKTTNNTKSTKK